MKSIRSKITVTYVVLALSIVVGVSAVLGWELESYVKVQLVQDLSREADWVVLSLERDSSSTLHRIDRDIRQIAGLENIRITLIDNNGRVLDDSDVPLEEIPSVENHLQRPEIQEAIVQDIGSNMRLSATVGRRYLYVAKRLTVAPSLETLRNVSFVRISMPLEDVLDRVNSLRALIAFVGVAILIVVIAVSIVVSQRISKPMVNIARSVERIRAGDLDAHVEVNTKDEIGRVATAINELVDKLKTDINEVKKLQKVRSEFLGNVSHELRTPIFAIQGFIETLLNGAVDDRSVNKAFLQKTKANADRLSTLLEDLINISQIESGEMKMSFRYFNMNEFLEGVVHDFQELAKQKDIAISGSFTTARDVEVFGDRDRLRQVLNNLIDNSIKYSPHGGKVLVSSDDVDGSVRVSVADTGAGMAAEHLPRIFERFYRVDKDRSREVGGTGLGLAIVKHIIEAHGSSIDVRSEVGKGSTFSFQLKK